MAQCQLQEETPTPATPLVNFVSVGPVEQPVIYPKRVLGRHRNCNRKNTTAYESTDTRAKVAKKKKGPGEWTQVLKKGRKVASSSYQQDVPKEIKKPKEPLQEQKRDQHQQQQKGEQKKSQLEQECQQGQKKEKSQEMQHKDPQLEQEHEVEMDEMPPLRSASFRRPWTKPSPTPSLLPQSKNWKNKIRSLSIRAQLSRLPKNSTIPNPPPVPNTPPSNTPPPDSTPTNSTPPSTSPQKNDHFIIANSSCETHFEHFELAFLLIKKN
ncbi:unnamed protein product [Acanthosepion pharaonis]|uniref:Uncharacterized protein n=1 Tax=Acanthosepion pharaonis TaxID=158019 RepID=A0A812BXZ5_ACAPH|nr:unnamed protein product [Sepia pharaonis]